MVETLPGFPDSVNILVDCGTASGDDLAFAQFPVPPDKIDYLFLTHAHIEHIGRVPDLLDVGFRGEIIYTHYTKALHCLSPRFTLGRIQEPIPISRCLATGCIPELPKEIWLVPEEEDARRTLALKVSAISTAPCRRDNSQFFRSNIPGQERLVVLQH